jgi:hypothetical protein
MADSNIRKDPSVDELEVVRVLLLEMQGGSRPRLISDELGRSVLEKYRTSIRKRLEEGKWEREGPRVRNAARQLGIIAGAIASLHHSDSVKLDWLEEAAQLTEKNCGIDDAGIQPGRWCERDPSAIPPH